MQSGISCSKQPDPWWSWTLLRKNVTRFWPIWGGYLTVWVLMLPAMLLAGGLDSDTILHTLNPLGLGLAAVFGVCSAMSVFSYLYRTQSVGMIHSLPIRREGLFLTNYISGLSFLLIPQVLVLLLTLLVQCLGGNPTVPVLQWFLAQTFMVLFFYSFAVFCAMFTGNLLALPVFYGILNLLALGMCELINSLMGKFVYGFSSLDILERMGTWLSPVMKLFQGLSGRYDGGVYSYRGIPIALLYALVGLVLAALALAVYRRRQLETAGDIVAVGWVRPVFKYGVAFCSAVALGSWLYNTFRLALPTGPWSMLVLLLLCGLLGYFAAEMLLKKSFHVLARSWKGALALCLVLTAAALFMIFDLVGFNRPPALESIQSVSVWRIDSAPWDSGEYGALQLTDREDIETVLKIHTLAARNAHAYQQELGRTHTFATERTLETGAEVYLDEYKEQQISLRYTLLDGSVRYREYTIPMYYDDLSDPDSPAALLTGLLNRVQHVEQTYFGQISDDALLVESSLRVYDVDAGEWTDVTVSDDDDRAALLEAVRADIAAGRIGRRFLFADMERYETCYTTDIRFHFYKSLQQNDGKQAGTETAEASWSATIRISLQTTATDTLSCLKRLGILDEDHVLLTHAEIPSSGEMNSAALVPEERESK